MPREYENSANGERLLKKFKICYLNEKQTPIMNAWRKDPDLQNYVFNLRGEQLKEFLLFLLTTPRRADGYPFEFVRYLIPEIATLPENIPVLEEIREILASSESFSKDNGRLGLNLKLLDKTILAATAPQKRKAEDDYSEDSYAHKAQKSGSESTAGASPAHEALIAPSGPGLFSASVREQAQAESAAPKRSLDEFPDFTAPSYLGGPYALVPEENEQSGKNFWNFN